MPRTRPRSPPASSARRPGHRARCRHSARGSTGQKHPSRAAAPAGSRARCCPDGGWLAPGAPPPRQQSGERCLAPAAKGRPAPPGRSRMQTEPAPGRPPPGPARRSPRGATGPRPDRQRWPVTDPDPDPDPDPGPHPAAGPMSTPPASGRPTRWPRPQTPTPAADPACWRQPPAMPSPSRLPASRRWPRPARSSRPGAHPAGWHRAGRPPNKPRPAPGWPGQTAAAADPAGGGWCRWRRVAAGS